MKKAPLDGVIPANMHMLVTEFSLDHWLAQNFKMNVTEIPPVRPSHVPVSL